MKRRNGYEDSIEAEVMERLGEEGLDAVLRSKAQRVVARAVRSLPEDTPSLAWRSALNAKIAQQGRRAERRARMRWAFAPVGGLAVAGVLAFSLLLRGGAPNADRGGLEAKLLSIHREMVVGRAAVGRGLASHEARPTNSNWEPYGWEEADLEAL